jgi:hypothetical protein
VAPPHNEETLKKPKKQGQDFQWHPTNSALFKKQKKASLSAGLSLKMIDFSASRAFQCK